MRAPLSLQARNCRIRASHSNAFNPRHVLFERYFATITHITLDHSHAVIREINLSWIVSCGSCSVHECNAIKHQRHANGGINWVCLHVKLNKQMWNVRGSSVLDLWSWISDVTRSSSGQRDPTYPLMIFVLTQMSQFSTARSAWKETEDRFILGCDGV